MLTIFYGKYMYMFMLKFIQTKENVLNNSNYIIILFFWQNMSVIYLKSNFEYLRGNYRKAMKMLGSAPSSQVFTDAGECLPVMYNNNLGCVHFHLRKHHLGAFYFRKALQENENALRDIKRGAEHSKDFYAPGLNRGHIVFVLSVVNFNLFAITFEP